MRLPVPLQIFTTSLLVCPSRAAAMRCARPQVLRLSRKRRRRERGVARKRRRRELGGQPVAAAGWFGAGRGGRELARVGDGCPAARGGGQPRPPRPARGAPGTHLGVEITRGGRFQGGGGGGGGGGGVGTSKHAPMAAIRHGFFASCSHAALFCVYCMALRVKNVWPAWCFL